MNRKRFVKLMMARGYSRNTAMALAAHVSRYRSYAVMYQQLTSVPTLLSVPASTIHGIYNALAGMCDAVAAAFSGFAESMRRAVDG